MRRKEMSDLRLRLTVDVAYTANGVSAEELAVELEALLDHADQNGLFTGDTDAELDGYVCSISELKE
jgi:hypothetical protein